MKDFQKRCWINIKKVALQSTLGKQRGKWEQTLLKSEQRHVYHIY